MKFAAIIIWLVFGTIAYGGQMAHSRVDRYPDSICRRVNSAEVCDDRLAVERSSYLIWGLVGGPISFVATAATTGFFYAGLAFK